MIEHAVATTALVRYMLDEKIGQWVWLPFVDWADDQVHADKAPSDLLACRTCLSVWVAGALVFFPRVRRALAAAGLAGLAGRVLFDR